MKYYNYPLDLSMGEISDLENALRDQIKDLNHLIKNKSGCGYGDNRGHNIMSDEVKRLNRLLIKIRRTEPENVCVEDDSDDWS